MGYRETLTHRFPKVCHDYKGGYKEEPYDLSYTFNFWSSCNIFVYFAHHRVTIPPPGWVNAAHRQGVKMLGTLIFEDSGEKDCLQLLVGKLPTSTSGPAAQPPPSSRASLPVSPHYARLLARLAAQRGFDGYLLNFECPLRGGPEQTRALATWIAILRNELIRAVGPHAHVSWYDSVVTTGHLAWQDRLNAHNVPFFLPADSFFTNYTWRPHAPAATAAYFLSLDPPLVQGKTLRDIYVGVDVWGRGQHGGGGLACFRALEHIAPSELGLSAAVFGQAWSWESQQDDPGWSWAVWWARERLLWAGASHNGLIDLPEAPRREGEPECPHGRFRPVGEFFKRSAPPNPARLPLHTTFCPGVGEAWFVEGRRASGAARMPWTDVDKQTSLGVVWPRPRVAWEDAEKGEEGLPAATADVTFDDAWNAGSALQVELVFPASEAEDAAYRCVWVPVQPLSLTPGHAYQVAVVYKVLTSLDAAPDLEIGVAVKATDGTDVTAEPIGEETLQHGWTRLRLAVSVSTVCSAEAGLVVALVAEDTSQPLDVTIIFGQLNVCLQKPASSASSTPTVLWVDYAPLTMADNSPSDDTAVLTWETAAALPYASFIPPISPEDPRPAWAPQARSPDFLYFNIYVQYYADGATAGPPDSAQWIGTTGMDGTKHSFTLAKEKVRTLAGGAPMARFYVQGVTDDGEVGGWDQCAYVEVAVA